MWLCDLRSTGSEAAMGPIQGKCLSLAHQSTGIFMILAPLKLQIPATPRML